MAGLKVVALISGGKDSLFSILHCLANGHEVVALANLHPRIHHSGDAAEDLDSYMYQTIGHAVIPLYEEALGLPLYRQEIIGTAQNTNKSYGLDISTASAEDETESLVPLLLKIRASHPDLNAVSTGAILSDYQRTRVESVAIRLGLIPLSFLWQWPNLPPHSPTSLLEDMAAIGQDSRIIKVASGGLDETFLWSNVSDTLTIHRLNKAAEKFGSTDDGAVLGEGGEYETLTVSGPAPLWKGRIVVKEDQRQIIEGEAGSASVRVLSAEVVANASVGTGAALRIPLPLDEDFQRILDFSILSSGCNTNTAGLISNEMLDDMKAISNFASNLKDSTTVLLHGLIGEGDNAVEQMVSIMETARIKLSNMMPTSTLTDIAYTSIILRDISDFASVNSIYGSYFLKPNPPARVTVACADVLPEGKDIMVGFTCLKNKVGLSTTIRRGLHVQSRSYWAPANIGPYSQAISVPRTASPTEIGNGDIIYIAGQIPLVPASMETTGSGTRNDFMNQTVLALQHTRRIGVAMKVVHWVAAIAFVSQASQDVHQQAHQIHVVWAAFHNQVNSRGSCNDEELEDYDIWDATHGSGRAFWHAQAPRSWQLDTNVGSGEPPPLWIVQVDSLPRGAMIEWVAYGSTSEGDPQEIEHLKYLLHTFKNRLL